MMYTSAISIFFLIAAVTAAYAAGSLSRRANRFTRFLTAGQPVLRAMLYLFAALCIAGNIVGISTLPTL